MAQDVRNIPAFLLCRERDDGPRRSCHRWDNISTVCQTGMFARIALDSLLKGHRGCVNHVQFNDSGKSDSLQTKQHRGRCMLSAFSAKAVALHGTNQLPSTVCQTAPACQQKCCSSNSLSLSIGMRCFTESNRAPVAPMPCRHLLLWIYMQTVSAAACRVVACDRIRRLAHMSVEPAEQQTLRGTTQHWTHGKHILCQVSTHNRWASTVQVPHRLHTRAVCTCQWHLLSPNSCVDYARAGVLICHQHSALGTNLISLIPLQRHNITCEHTVGVLLLWTCASLGKDTVCAGCAFRMQETAVNRCWPAAQGTVRCGCMMWPQAQL